MDREDDTLASDGTAVRPGADGTSVRDGAAPNGVTPVGMAVPGGVGTGGVGAGGRLWDSSLLGIYPGWLGLELPVRAATGVNRMCSAETKRCKNDAFRRSHGLQFEMA